MARNTFSPGAVSVTLALITVFVYAGFSSRVQARGSAWWLALVAGICVGLLQYTTRRLRADEQREAQSSRDEKATQAAAVAVPQDESFWLYLRPFLSTGKLVVKNPEYSFIPSVSRFTEGEFIDTETLFARVLEPSTKLVAFGRPGEHIGGGRVLATEEEWRDRFANLAERATGILLVPSHREGTLWEMRWLKEHGHLNKCVFVMYPRLAAGDFDTCGSWNAAQTASASIGITLPNHDQAGMLLLLDDNGVPRVKMEFQPRAMAELRDSMKKGEWTGVNHGDAAPKFTADGPRWRSALRVLALLAPIAGALRLTALPQHQDSPHRASTAAIGVQDAAKAPDLGSQEAARPSGIIIDRATEKAVLLADLCKRRLALSIAAAPPYQIKNRSSTFSRVAAIQAELGHFCEALDAHVDWARRGLQLEGGILWSIPAQSYGVAADTCRTRLKAIQGFDPQKWDRGGQRQFAEIAQSEIAYASSYAPFCPRNNTTADASTESK